MASNNWRLFPTLGSAQDIDHKSDANLFKPRFPSKPMIASNENSDANVHARADEHSRVEPNEMSALAHDIEETLKSEDETLRNGFEVMDQRLQKDLAESGQKNLLRLLEDLRQHQVSVQSQFESMTKRFEKDIESLTNFGDANSNNLQDANKKDGGFLASIFKALKF